jgi:hypothetical protein
LGLSSSTKMCNALKTVLTGLPVTRCFFSDQKMYKMECEPFFGAGTPSLADQSRRASINALLTAHSNRFQAPVPSSKCLNSVAVARPVHAERKKRLKCSVDQIMGSPHFGVDALPTARSKQPHARLRAAHTGTWLSWCSRALPETRIRFGASLVRLAWILSHVVV